MQKTILIIEDDVLSMKLFTDLLQSHGFNIVTSIDGMDILQLSREHNPDLIIMDIQLPKISGVELTKMLKNDDELKSIPVLAVTSFAMKGDERKIRDAGCDGYISKPISVPLFIDEVTKHLAFSPFRLIDALTTGHPTIDEEHEGIVVFLNKIRISLDTGQYSDCDEQIRNIHTAIKRHFTSEEAIMSGLGYGGLSSHKNDHAIILESFNTLINDVAEAGYKDNFFNKLTSIIVHDMIHSDTEFKDFLVETDYRP